jgi:predicted SnoaL-like aldol condensation-catalyzing enzyme
LEDCDAYDFIYDYFNEIFNKRNIDELDIYLDENYYDDDIGEGSKNHIRNSKEYLSNIFKKNPTIEVEVIKVIVRDNVITAYLEWKAERNSKKVILRKGIGIFEIKENKIIRRHTYIYYQSKE